MPKTAMYVLQGVDPAVIAAAPFDVKVVEVYTDDGQMFTPAEVKQMGGGPGQALLLGYFSLGEAEAYRDYFASIPSEALGPEDPNWAGDFEVAYWTPEWKGVAEASIDRMVKAGYDGIYFDVVDAFQLPWSQAHAPRGDAAGAMQTLVQELSAYAKAQAPTFKVWVNGAEELLTDKAYVDSIDGLFKENLFYNDDGSAKQPTAETQASLDQLKIAQDAGKDVVAIEYVTGAQKVADVHAQAEAAGMGSYVAKLDLIGVDTEGVLPGQIMHDDGLLHDDGRGGAAALPEPTPLTPPPATTPGDQDGTATRSDPTSTPLGTRGTGTTRSAMATTRSRAKPVPTASYSQTAAKEQAIRPPTCASRPWPRWPTLRSPVCLRPAIMRPGPIPARTSTSPPITPHIRGSAITTSRCSERDAAPSARVAGNLRQKRGRRRGGPACLGHRDRAALEGDEADAPAPQGVDHEAVAAPSDVLRFQLDALDRRDREAALQGKIGHGPVEQGTRGPEMIGRQAPGRGEVTLHRQQGRSAELLAEGREHDLAETLLQFVLEARRIGSVERGRLRVRRGRAGAFGEGSRCDGPIPVEVFQPGKRGFSIRHLATRVIATSGEV